MPHRVDKVAAQLREEISVIIGQRVHDPRVGMISITSVDLSPDLRNARVRVSTLGGEDQRKDAMDALDGARGFIRHELAGRVRLRRVPDLRFVDDRNIEYAVHIGQVLDEILPEENIEG
jgi:ribosome-binding factor A